MEFREFPLLIQFSQNTKETLSRTNVLRTNVMYYDLTSSIYSIDSHATPTVHFFHNRDFRLAIRMSSDFAA